MARGSISRSPGKGKKIAVFPYDVQQEEFVAPDRIEDTRRMISEGHLKLLGADSND